MTADNWEARMAMRARWRGNEQLRNAIVEAAKDPTSGIYLTPDGYWAAHPDACRDCDEPRPHPSPEEPYGWVVWMACGWPCRFGHDHHGGEIPIG